MTRSFVLRALPLVGLLCAGAIVLALAGGHTAVLAVGFATIAVAGVLLAALFFYEVGRSEDRARAGGGGDARRGPGAAAWSGERLVPGRPPGDDVRPDEADARERRSGGERQQRDTDAVHNAAADHDEEHARRREKQGEQDQPST